MSREHAHGRGTSARRVSTADATITGATALGPPPVVGAALGLGADPRIVACAPEPEDRVTPASDRLEVAELFDRRVRDVDLRTKYPDEPELQPLTICPWPQPGDLEHDVVLADLARDLADLLRARAGGLLDLVRTVAHHLAEQVTFPIDLLGPPAHQRLDLGRGPPVAADAFRSSRSVS